MRISSSVIVLELEDSEVFTGSVKPVIILEVVDVTICSVQLFYERRKHNVHIYTGKLNNDNTKIEKKVSLL